MSRPSSTRTGDAARDSTAGESVETWTMVIRISFWTAHLAIENDVYPAHESFHRMAIRVSTSSGRSPRRFVR